MFTFTITPDDAEPFEVKAGSRDVYVWEKAGRDRSLKRLLDELRISDLYEVSHIAARRQQLYGGTLADFASSCELDFEEEAQEPEPDPTRPGR